MSQTSSTTSVASNTTTSSTPTMNQIVTPEMRNAAIKMIEEGATPSSIGEVLPSPNPNYLRGLYLGVMSNLRDYLKPGQINVVAPSIAANTNVNHNDAILYFKEWKIEEVVKKAHNKPPDDLADFDIEEYYQMREGVIKEHIQTVQRAQKRVARKLNLLQVEVHEWDVLDEVKAARDRDAFEVIVADPMVKQPGALENLVDYWRAQIGWTGPTTDRVPVPNLRFVAYVPVNITDEPQPLYNADVLQQGTRYVFSDATGTWQTEEGLARERKRIDNEHNARLTNMMSRIETQRDIDLYQEGASSVLCYINTTLLGNKAVDDVDAKYGWKATGGRKPKKQIPTRAASTVPFVPEDGGLTAFERLVEAAASAQSLPAAPSEVESTIEEGAVVQSIEVPIEGGVKRKRGEEDARTLTLATNVMGPPPAKKRKEAAAPSKARGTSSTTIKKPAARKPSARAPAAAAAPEPSLRRSTRATRATEKKRSSSEREAGEEAPVEQQPAKRQKRAKSKAVAAPVEKLDTINEEAEPTSPLPPPPQQPAREPTPILSASEEITTPVDVDIVTPPEPASQLVPASNDENPISLSSSLAPPSAVSREALMTTYPFLNQLPDNEGPTGRREMWLDFLHVFGHDQGNVSSINMHFGMNGALECALEFLETLKDKIGEARRVDDVEGEARFVWKN